MKEKLDWNEWLGLIFIWICMAAMLVAYVVCPLFIAWGIIRWMLGY